MTTEPVETLRRALTLINAEAGASGMMWEDVQVCDQLRDAVSALESGQPVAGLEAILIYAGRVITALDGDA